jgi:hypothetical protein
MPAEVADLLLVGQAAAAHLAGEGRPLTRAALIAGLRDSHRPCLGALRFTTQVMRNLFEVPGELAELQEGPPV